MNDFSVSSVLIISYLIFSESDNFLLMHHKNFQILVTKMFRVYTGIAPNIFNETFIWIQNREKSLGRIIGEFFSLG